MQPPVPATDGQPAEQAVVSGERLVVSFPDNGWVLRPRRFNAIQDVSVCVPGGTVLGVVGESGCGKSTLARTLIGLQQPAAGRVRVDGNDIWALSPQARRSLVARTIGMVFQDPSSSLNPRLSVRTILRDPLEIHKYGTRAEIDRRVDELLNLVSLPATAASRIPRELSGGQRQRVAIARSIALEPKVIVADEPTSAIDVSVRAQILNLFNDLRRRLGVAMVYISHDIHTIRYLSDRVVVMYLGRVVEEGPVADVTDHPCHPYTASLFSATPTLTGKRGERIVLEGSVPSVRTPPMGCPFCTRCWRATEACAERFPEPTRNGTHRFHCIHPL